MMKKRLLTGLAVTVLGAAFLTGCAGTNGAAQSDNASGGTSSAEAGAVTPQITEDTNATVTDIAGAASDENTGAASGQNSSSGDIGEAQARAIALEHAGLAESDVVFLTVQLDRDDGRTEYEVEFYSGNTEYDYEIDASTGTILSYDHDIEHYDVQTQAQQTGDAITLEAAKEAALNAAGLNAADVRWVKEKLDWDDGRTVYELECISGEWEYDFEINAADGSVLEQDRDSVYD